MSEISEISDMPAPFRSSPARVREEWIDYNGHMNVAYYVLLFDRCVDEAFHTLGLGPDYLRERKASFFTVEMHIHYLRELPPGAEVEATLQLLAFDAKRVRAYLELMSRDGGYLAASAEHLFLHIDMTSRRVAPFPEDVLARLARMQAAHAGLPWPARAGRAIAFGAPAGA
jgi:acyl-CoA thioester hydrolase